MNERLGSDLAKLAGRLPGGRYEEETAKAWPCLSWHPRSDIEVRLWRDTRSYSFSVRCQGMKCDSRHGLDNLLQAMTLAQASIDALPSSHSPTKGDLHGETQDPEPHQ